MRITVCLSLVLCFLKGTAQVIHFISDPHTATSIYAVEQPLRYGLCVDSLQIDTVYIENSVTGEMDMHVQRYPLSRYEYYQDGALYRRIAILQQDDTREIGFRPDLATGDTIAMLQVVTIDIPNGAYHEFFPNGNIRIMGTLDGYNANGTLKKTGEWKEWDANGNVVRRETYP